MSENEYIEIKVTHMKEGFGIRIIDNRTGDFIFPNGEAIVKNKMEISTKIAEMLRWHNKCGGTSNLASASRERNCHE